jgi:chromosome segregation ATPase
MPLAIVIALFAATLLAGCQPDRSQELAVCKDKNALLERRMVEYKQVVDMKDKDIKDRYDEIKGLTDTIAQNEVKIATLEKENQELHTKLTQTPEGSKNVLNGVEELKRLQREAAEKLKKQQADANKPQ